MKLDELIADLEADAAILDAEKKPLMAERSRNAAETIRLLWEIAKDSSNAKYRRQIDEWRGEDG